jgi:hypothetical protein
VLGRAGAPQPASAVERRLRDGSAWRRRLARAPAGGRHRGIRHLHHPVAERPTAPPHEAVGDRSTGRGGGRCLSRTRRAPRARGPADGRPPRPIRRRCPSGWLH